jgi:hypothetical protein
MRQRSARRSGSSPTAAPPAEAATSAAVDETAEMDETGQRARGPRRDDRYDWPSDSPVIEVPATLDTVHAYARRDRACSESAAQQASRRCAIGHIQACGPGRATTASALAAARAFAMPLPTNALVCAGQRRRLLSPRSGRVHRRRETTPSSPEQPRWKGLGLRSRLRYPTRSHSRASVSSVPTAGLDPPACLTLAVADPRAWLSFAQPWLNETANSEGIVQAASAPRS